MTTTEVTFRQRRSILWLCVDFFCDVTVSACAPCHHIFTHKHIFTFIRADLGRKSVLFSSTHRQVQYDVFRCVLSTFHGRVGCLDRASDFDLFVLHAVFLPKVGHCLKEFVHSLNCHPLCPEHNWSPRKLLVKWHG